MRRRLAQTQEQIVLDLLQRRYGEVVSRREIIDAIYPDGEDRPASAAGMVDVAVTRLRKAGRKIYCAPREGFWVGPRPVAPEPDTRLTRPPAPKTKILAPQTKTVLTVLLKRRGQVVSPDALAAALYPDNQERPASASTSCYKIVSRLRRAGVRVETIHGDGFRLLGAG